MPMPSANGISIMDKEYSSPSNKKSIDELKRQVTKLKAELESERSKLKQVHRDKTSELKRIQENHEKERQKTIETVTKRLQNEHSVELRRIRENLTKEKDNELRQVLKFKDEELKAFKQQIQEEKDRAKRAEEEFKRHLTVKSNGNTNDIEKRLRDELSDIKEQKRKTDESYRLKCAADFEKAELIRRLKSEHEREVNELIRQSKREVAKEYHHLRSAEKALEEKNHELAFKDQLTRKLEAEKQEIRHRTSSADLNVSESPLRSRRSSGTHESTLLESSPEADDVFQLSNKVSKDKERELRKKNAELQSKLDRLEKKCTLLEKENTSRQTGTQKASSLAEEKVKKLKKRNSELVSIARQLEEKAKKLQEEKNAVMKQANSKDDPSAEVEHMKRMFARQRAKDLAEHARIKMEKENELEKLREELTSLSDGKSATQNEKIGELQSIIKKTAKERLWLEKKLASTGSPCPSPLSSTPTGMGDLAKRLETYTNQAKTSEKEADRLKKELESKIKECEHLKQTAEETTVKCSKLELEREKFVVKCTMLHQKNVELGKRIKEITRLEEEIKCLKENLQNAEETKQLAEEECQKLRVKLEELVHVKEELKVSDKHRRELEAVQQTSQHKLKEREEEIKQLHKIQEESTRAHRLAVTSLEQDLRKLEQKCADSNLRATNAKNELERLKSRGSDKHKATQTSRPSSPVQQSEQRKTLQLKLVPKVQDKPCHTDRQTNILNTAASRIKQLAMSESSEEDSSYSVGDAPSDSTKEKAKISVGGKEEEDDIAVLSRRISQAALSDDSSVSAADNNYDSDASRDGNSMAEGDMADMEDNNDVTRSLQMGDEEDRNTYLNSNRKGDENETMDERYLQQKPSEDEEDEEDEEADNLSVYIARYSYDPFQHSPNDNPEAELAFQAGDYLYVFGDVDDDGFYLGELMDGQRGLVPSNFVEKIADENDMAWMTNGVDQQPAEIASSSDDEDLSQTDDDDEHKGLMEKPTKVVKFSGKLHRNLRLNVEHIPDSKLCDIEEEDVTTEASREVLRDSHDGLTSDDTDLEPSAIPSPQRLVLSRQFTRSILLNWKPADLPIDEIEGYTVHVDGELKVIIKGGHNTKALIEDIDPNETYRVSVRTVTKGGEESLDQEALLTIGKDASTTPIDVKVTDISPTSAKLKWLPSNSSFIHEILVNGTPRQTVAPGTRQLTLTNLEPSEHYRIHVRAKNPSVTEDDNPESLGETVEFTTQAAGLPDPPLDVHLVPTSSRSGPNTLEVSWIPVTITEQGMSNGAPVTGYKVYINDFAVAEVTSPTADCVTVASWMIERAAKKSKNETLQLVVKTQSSRGESVPSNYLSIPVTTFNFHMNKLIGSQPMGISVKPKEHSNVIPMGSGNEQGCEDDNHNLTNVKEPIDSNVNDGTYTEVIPRNADTRKPPVPKARTKGKPVVWKMEVSEDDVTSDSGDSNKGEHGGSSNNEEDEHVEICSPEPVVQDNDKEQQGDTNKEYPDLTEKNLAEHAKEPERKMSELSDIDLEELNDSLNSATSFKRDKKRHDKREENTEPFVYPLELSDSEVGNSSDDEPLSVIDEVEEMEEVEDEVVEEDIRKGAATESGQERSRSSHSTSDSFRSDDDVMDLLGEEPEDSQERNAVTTANIRKMSQEADDADLNQTYDVNQASLQKYLVSSAEPEPTESGEGDAGYHNQTYSDIEADQPNQTSTPRITIAHPEPEHQPAGQETPMKDDEIYDSDTDGNRTYKVSEKGEYLGEEQLEVEEPVRIFIALYDYDPTTMSPNPGAEEDELTFNEGDLIKIYGDKDEDGFYWGELEGMTGFVPHNMVSEVQVDDEDLLDRTVSSIAAETQGNNVPNQEYQPNEFPEYLHPEDHNSSQYPKVVIQHAGDQPEQDMNYFPEQDEEEIAYEDPRKSMNYSLKPKKMVALFDYDPQLLSPNPDSEVELRFRAGDIIYAYGEMDEDGFYTGEQGGVRGLVPSNFLEDIKEKPSPPSNEHESSFTSQDISDSSYVSQESSDPGPSKTSTPNGTHPSKEEPPKKKKGLLSKGKQMFKKMTKSQASKR